MCVAHVCKSGLLQRDDFDQMMVRLGRFRSLPAVQHSTFKARRGRGGPPGRAARPPRSGGALTRVSTAEDTDSAGDAAKAEPGLKPRSGTRHSTRAPHRRAGAPCAREERAQCARARMCPVCLADHSASASRRCTARPPPRCAHAPAPTTVLPRRSAHGTGCRRAAGRRARRSPRRCEQPQGGFLRYVHAR